MQPKILLADDHIMISKGFRKLLEYDFNYTDVFSVTTCKELMQELNKKTYTHLIVDIGLSDGSALEVLPPIQKLYPDLCIMFFSAKPAVAYDKALRQHGIYYFLSKEAGEDETKRKLLHFFDNDLRPYSNSETGTQDNPFSNLTSRELEVLHYVLTGAGTKEISSALNLKQNTVSTFKSRIYDKIQVANHNELMELARLYKVV